MRCSRLFSTSSTLDRVSYPALSAIILFDEPNSGFTAPDEIIDSLGPPPLGEGKLNYRLPSVHLSLGNNVIAQGVAGLCMPRRAKTGQDVDYAKPKHTQCSQWMCCCWVCRKGCCLVPTRTILAQVGTTADHNWACISLDVLSIISSIGYNAPDDSIY